MKFKNITSALGITAPVLYLFAVVFGSVMWAEYNSLRDPISLLASDGSPYKQFINVLFIVYNTLLVLFGIGWKFVQQKETKKGNISAVLIALQGALGITLAFFPQDAMGVNITIYGVMHIIIVALMSLITILAIFFRGFSERENSSEKKMSVYTFCSLIFAIVTGILTTINFVVHWELGGLFERLTLAGFLQWVFIEALALLQQKKR